MNWKIPLADLDFGPEESTSGSECAEQPLADHG